MAYEILRKEMHPFYHTTFKQTDFPQRECQD